MFKSIIFNLQTDMPYRSPGAHRIATIMRKNDWDVEVIDWANYFSLDELKLLATQRIDSSTKLLGFSCTFGLYPPEIDSFISWVKINYPQVKMVIGGQYIPDTISKDIDYYITGFGENAILALLKNLVGNGPSVRFKIMYDKKVIDGNSFYPSAPLKDLDIVYEKRDYIESNEWLGIELGRGCKFECPYCNFPILGVKGDYTRDADNYTTQLQRTYDDYGVTKYLIGDETINESTEKLIKFADATEQLSFNPYFSGFIRADLLVLRKQDREHMARMGLLGHFYGIETMNTPTAKFIGKGIKKERLQQGLLDVISYFKSESLPYRATIALVIGLPGETVDTQQDTFDWIDNYWIKNHQSVKSFGLEIPSVDSKSLKPSKISLDLQKYGYRLNTEEEYDDSYNIFKHNHVINWQNDHFTHATAKKMAYDFNDSTINTNPVNNFTMAHFFEQPKSLINDNVLEEIINNETSTYYFAKQAHIEKYKRKKLNQ
jgi:hypothetical protein